MSIINTWQVSINEHPSCVINITKKSNKNVIKIKIIIYLSNYSLFKISLNIIVMFKIFKYFTSFTSLLARHESSIVTQRQKKLWDLDSFPLFY